MAVEPKEWVSEAAQTSFRDSETQHLVWDSTTEPPRHPFTFPRGRGLHYPVIFDPAWPVHIAAPKRLTPPVAPLKENFAIGTYALKGMTLGETERKPIKKTLVFPHRNTDLPFRHPTLKVQKFWPIPSSSTTTFHQIPMNKRQFSLLRVPLFSI
uniref:Uncharacterized protein n=1 Tax=Physcomitrium patens TaxID=3218 RepID=A0A2K1IDI6_PHYPA|nr:hypothetical protein PHYPA_029491 [Physcomitrium patens]